MRSTKRAILSVGAAVSAVLLATSAFAQSTETDDLLGEVVVTATRQAESANRISVAISVVSQEGLTNQGIRSTSDLQQIVPGLTFFVAANDRSPQITLRGIGGSGSSRGAQTTGVYLDDTALQRVMVNGLRTGNGAPFPNLFDLERVEVLRGPQGTLYGDSSEGGTVRYITPTPSLTEYSGRVRVDGSHTLMGGMSGEGGFAFGGPLIEDKLGFRVSGDVRRESGWIDAKSIYDGMTFAKDVNWTEARYTRAALRWAATDTFTVSPAVYWGFDKTNDGNSVWGPVPAISWDGATVYNGENGLFTQASGRPPTNVTSGARGVGSLTYFDPAGGVVNYYWKAPDVTTQPFSQNAMPWYNWDSTGVGDYRSTAPGDVDYIPSPRSTALFLPTLTLDKDFGSFALKSITSYIRDDTHGVNSPGGVGGGTRNTGAPYSFGPAHFETFDAGELGVLQPDANGCMEGFNQLRAGNCYFAPRYIPGFADYADRYFYNNKRIAKSEEIRFNSTTDGALSWVAGAYYNTSKIHMAAREVSNENVGANLITGIDGIWRGKSMYMPEFGPYSPPGQNAVATRFQDVSDRHVRLGEETWAIFGEGNYNLTEKFKLTLGARYNVYKQDFQEQYAGLVAGTPPTFVPDPAVVQSLSEDPTQPNSPTNPINLATVPGGSALPAYGPLPPVIQALFATDMAGCSEDLSQSSPNCTIRYTNLHAKEKNFTPKVGLTYEFNPTNLVYATYAKGFRPGGANAPILSAQCVQALADLGLTSSPTSYKQDTVTSYEIGNKVRVLDGRVQLNSSAFYIDWQNMQYTQSVACGFDFLNNAGHVTSTGAEIQASGRFGPMGLGLNAAYTRAVFAENILSNATNPNSNIVRKKGDNIGGVPEWTVSANAQYNYEIGTAPAFVRADYSWSSSFINGSKAELDRYNAGLSNSYNPWSWKTPANYNLNLRASVNLLDLDWALYVQNATNKQPIHRLSGTSANADGGYLSAQMRRPRTVGLQINYSF